MLLLASYRAPVSPTVICIGLQVRTSWTGRLPDLIDDRDLPSPCHGRIACHSSGLGCGGAVHASRPELRPGFQPLQACIFLAQIADQSVTTRHEWRGVVTVGPPVITPSGSWTVAAPVNPPSSLTCPQARPALAGGAPRSLHFQAHPTRWSILLCHVKKRAGSRKKIQGRLALRSSPAWRPGAGTTSRCPNAARIRRSRTRLAAASVER